MTSEVEALDLVWGIKGIAKLIGRTERQTYEMCASGALPARRVGQRWVISRRKLAEFFTGEAA